MNLYIKAERSRQLVFLTRPISVTCSVFDDVLLVDPTSVEEQVQRGSITCVFDETDTMVLLSQVCGTTLRIGKLK